VNVIFSRKTGANPENTVGLMTMAGKTPQVLVTPTADIGKILAGLHETSVSEEADVITALNVAQLALKHRQNKNQRQRIVAFVGSPLKPKADEKALVRLAKKLKKNNVAVDIVSFGEDEIEENEGLLKAFVDTVQSSDNSHLVTVPATGNRLLSEVISGSPILMEEGAAAGFGEPSGSGGGEGFEFGVDPSLDPELALALRMSLEEERARMAAQSDSAAPAAEGAATTTLAPIPENAGAAASAPAPANLMDEDAEDEELAQAILLSQQEAASGEEADVEMGEDDAAEEQDELADENMEEDDAIAAAIAMSLQEQQGDKKGSAPPQDKSKK